MKYLILVLTSLLTLPAWSQHYILQYDPAVLRIPGNSLPLGIVTITGKGDTSRTRGFLDGRDGWTHYRLEVDKGSFSNGRIKIAASDLYQRGDSLEVQVYTRKWLLGGKGKWLFTQKIPLDYETGIQVLTTGNVARAPGDPVGIGIRTWYDNKSFADSWWKKKKAPKGILFGYQGIHISHSLGSPRVDGDLSHITGDQVTLTAALAKDSLIRDTLRITLDYVAAYQCRIASAVQGNDLQVSADLVNDSIIHASLLSVVVNDAKAGKVWKYLVNTNGGSITITSKGGDGADGMNGMDGQSGSSGSDGTVSVNVETTTDPDGTPHTTTTTVTGAGGDGGNGSDGGNGGDGGDGYNGGNITVSYTAAVQPFLGLIKAVSQPGAAGSGGRGGSGGHGGTGGSGNPSGSSGLSGHDGSNGTSGSPGKAGQVNFRLMAG